MEDPRSILGYKSNFILVAEKTRVSVVNADSGQKATLVDYDGKGRPYGMVLVTLYRENLFASKGLLGLVAGGISVIVMVMVTLI